MADRQVTQLRLEAAARSSPASPSAREAIAASVESIARGSASRQAASAFAETLARGLARPLVHDMVAESVARAAPPIMAPALVVEVLRRDAAGTALRTTGYDAFGDAVRPDAPVGVFAFRHDWSEPVVERVRWRTQIERAASGQEVRVPLRALPRRELRLHVGHGRVGDGLVADWLTDHAASPAWWPLHQHAVIVRHNAPRGASHLAVDADAARLAAFEPLTATARLDASGLATKPDAPRWVWIDAVDGWQVARLAAISEGQLQLAEPLARPVVAGALVAPLVAGTALDAQRFAQAVPGVMAGDVTAQLAGASLPPGWVGLAALTDPRLDGVPVWPDANWRDDPQLTVIAEHHELDLSFAHPWRRRADPERVMTLQTRVLAERGAALDAWLARLAYAQGGLRTFYWRDGIAPVLTVSKAATVSETSLRVRCNGLAAFWQRPAACALLLPSGQRQHVLTNPMQFLGTDESALLLRTPLVAPVPAGTRLLRLARCRLDHDAIDLVWHTTRVVEITLTARAVAEPRGNDRDLPYGE